MVGISYYPSGEMRLNRLKMALAGIALKKPPNFTTWRKKVLCKIMSKKPTAKIIIFQLQRVPILKFPCAGFLIAHLNAYPQPGAFSTGNPRIVYT